MYTTITKRDGSIVEFDEECIARSIVAAYTATGITMGVDTLQEEVARVIDRLEKLDAETIDVEAVQDIVEEVLVSIDMDLGRQYILYRSEKNKKRTSLHSMDEDAISEYVFMSKYSRYLPAENRRESFQEAIDRVANMYKKSRPEAVSLITEAFESVAQKRVLPSMRSMQFAGPAAELHNPRIYNCSFSVLDRIDFFSEAMYLLLCGVGVGFSVEFVHFNKLPKLVNKIDATNVYWHKVNDSIEGWQDAVKAIVDSYMLEGSEHYGHYVDFNYTGIRAKGTPLKTSGGKAPGHVEFKKSMEKIRAILDGAIGRRLKTIEGYDMVMHLCDAVLAGGIRRSACICLFSETDMDMVNAKQEGWWETNPQRSGSNNSVKLIRDKVTQAQFEMIFRRQRDCGGEPGFYFANDENHGTNPCVEIGMDPFLKLEVGSLVSGWQFCNLTEINGAAVKTKEDFKTAVRAATIIGTLQASFTSFDRLGPITEAICKRDALLGVSITGMMDSPEIMFDASIQREMAEYAIEVNKEVATVLNIEQAARVTCVKPAGTTSLVLGTASGIHPRYAELYFRRVTANKEDNVFNFFKECNPEMTSQSVLKETDEVVEFCLRAPEGAITKKSMGAMGLLEKVLLTQQNWVKYGTAKTEGTKGLKHNVSNTITCLEHEWDEVMNFIWDHKEEFTGVSLLPEEAGGTIYPQAPHQEIVSDEEKEEWCRLCTAYKKVDYTLLKENEDNTEVQQTVACAGGSCSLL